MRDVHANNLSIDFDLYCLDIAHKIVLETNTRIKYFPKEYALTLTKPIENAANMAESKLKSAISYRNRSSRKEYLTRESLLNEAVYYLNLLSNKINLAYRLFHLNCGEKQGNKILSCEQISSWQSPINEELTLICNQNRLIL